MVQFIRIVWALFLVLAVLFVGLVFALAYTHGVYCGSAPGGSPTC